MRINNLIGLIPAAGRGMRLSTYTARIPKSLLRVAGRPIIERNICIMRDYLGIKIIYILVSYKKEQIMDYLKDGKDMGVSIVYIKVGNIQKGLAYGVLDAQKYIKNNFCVILGDEVYYDSNHSEMTAFLKKDFSAVCAVKKVRCPLIIKKNYSVEIKDNLIVSLIEKPEATLNNYLGCGTYLFKPDIFNYIKITPHSPKTKRVELVDVINLIAKKEGKVYPFMLKGGYINVNDVDDYNSANYMIRRRAA